MCCGTTGGHKDMVVALGVIAQLAYTCDDSCLPILLLDLLVIEVA